MREWLVVSDMSKEITDEMCTLMKTTYGFDTPDRTTIVGMVVASSIALAAAAFQAKVGLATKCMTGKKNDYSFNDTFITNMRVMVGKVVDTKVERQES